MVAPSACKPGEDTSVTLCFTSSPLSARSATVFGGAFARCHGSRLLTLRLPFIHRSATAFLLSPTLEGFHESCPDSVSFPVRTLSLSRLSASFVLADPLSGTARAVRPCASHRPAMHPHEPARCLVGPLCAFAEVRADVQSVSAGRPLRCPSEVSDATVEIVGVSATIQTLLELATRSEFSTRRVPRLLVPRSHSTVGLPSALWFSHTGHQRNLVKGPT
jgi:hypothetical protein